MALLHSDTELFDKLKKFISSSKNFALFAPYIKENPLSKLLSEIKDFENCTIVTTWKPRDIALGISDISVYSLCKEKNIILLINNRIHLKAYTVNDFDSCIVTSSNVSARGLALKKNYNYELGALIEELNIDDKIYFDTIIEESDEVTQSYYDQVKEQSAKLVLEKDMFEYFNIKKEPSDNDFLITALPMSDNIDVLFNVYNGNKNFEDDILRSTEHDIRLYKIPSNKQEKEFRKKLKLNYFNHPFIKKFIEFNGDGKYFGELTQWIHDNCTTVPAPRRFKIKEALQRIYKFTVALSDGDYLIDVPKSYSEVLKKVK
jgi:hypothetical protein